MPPPGCCSYQRPGTTEPRWLGRKEPVEEQEQETPTLPEWAQAPVVEVPAKRSGLGVVIGVTVGVVAVVIAAVVGVSVAKSEGKPGTPTPSAIVKATYTQDQLKDACEEMAVIGEAGEKDAFTDGFLTTAGPNGLNGYGWSADVAWTYVRAELPC
jgi:hypothetical protein